MIPLLTKIGLKGIKDLSDDELRQLVSNDRQHRALVRAAGRVKRMAKDAAQPKTHRPKTTLEAIGLDPNLIAKLRSGGRTDEEIIVALKKRGVL